MKKTLALVLAVVMLIGMFAGCNSGSSSNTGAAGTTAAAGGTTAAAASTTAAPDEKENFNPTGYPIVDEKIEIEVVIADDASGMSENPDQVMVWNVMEEVTNIHTNWYFLENDDAVINLYFAAGEFGDVFLSSLTTDRVQAWGVEGGVFADIAPYLNDLMPNLMSRLEEYPNLLKVSMQPDGKMFLVPQVRLGTTAANGQLYVRTDYLAELGLEEPKTVDEFYNTLVAIKDSGLTQGYAPLLYSSAQNLTTSHAPIFFMPALGGSLTTGYDVDENGKVFYVNTTEGMYRYIELFAKLYAEGLLDPEQFTIDSATYNARVKAGQAAFMNSASNVNPEDCLPNDGTVYLSMLSPLTSEYNSEQKVASYNYLSANAGGIKADSPYVREIIRWLDIAYAKDEVSPGTGLDSNSVNAGPKGVAYTVDETNNTFSFVVPEGSEHTGYAYVRRHYGWNVKYGIYDLEYCQNTTPNTYAREYAMSTKNIPFAQETFPANLLKFEEFEKTNIATQETDIGNYYTEMVAKFITGVEPLSNWDAYCAEIEKMGIADVLAVYQTAYDRWMAL